MTAIQYVGTATTVARDMTEGIVARFRSIAISRAAVIAAGGYAWALHLYNRRSVR